MARVKGLHNKPPRRFPRAKKSKIAEKPSELQQNVLEVQQVVPKVEEQSPRRSNRASHPTSTEIQPQSPKNVTELQQLAQENLSIGSQLYCEQCQKTFASVSSFNAHKKKHDGRRWQCTLCEEVFVTKFTYTRHIIRSHQRQHPALNIQNADEVEVYLSEDETAHLTEKAKDALIKRLNNKVQQQNETIKRMRAEIRKLKKKNNEAKVSNEDK